MNLTEADKKKILEWLEDKCGAMRCLACGQNQWELLPFSTLQIGFDLHTTRFHYHNGIPFIGITCVHCGYVMQFSSGVIGFKPEPPQKPEIKESEKGS